MPSLVTAVTVTDPTVTADKYSFQPVTGKKSDRHRHRLKPLKPRYPDRMVTAA